VKEFLNLAQESEVNADLLRKISRDENQEETSEDSDDPWKYLQNKEKDSNSEGESEDSARKLKKTG
jgi:hypothetical protein